MGIDVEGLGFSSLVLIRLVALPPQEDFLRGRIKVNKKTGNIGKAGEGKEVTLARDKNEVRVETEIPFSKRYGCFGVYVNSYPLPGIIQVPEVPYQEVSEEK